MKKPGLSIRAYSLLTLASLFFASNHIIGRAVHLQIPPVGLSFWRCVAGSLMLLPFTVPGMRRHWPVIREHARVFLLLGFLMIGSTTLILIALTTTMAINVSLINAVQPTLTVLFAWLLFSEPHGIQRTTGVICGILGVVVMLCRGDLAVLSGLDFVPGDFIALLAMCGFAGYALNLNRLPPEVGVIRSLLLITIAGAVILLPFYLWESVMVRPVPVTLTSITAITTLALVVTVMANLCWNAGNRIIGPSRASMFINLIPAFGVLLATSLLGEKLHVYHAVGGLLVVTGLVLAAARGRDSI